MLALNDAQPSSPTSQNGYHFRRVQITTAYCGDFLGTTYWRLDRIRAMENSLFGLAVSERTGEAVVRGSGEEPEMSPDPLLHCALAQAKSLDQHSDLLIRLSLYEHRLNRTLEKAKAELKQLQQERHTAGAAQQGEGGCRRGRN